PADVVVDRRHLRAGLGGRPVDAPLEAARRLGLAPLAVEIDQQLLARGLHAILAEREARRRLALAQQRDAVAQALRELARVQVARLLRRAGRTAALRQAIGGE